MQSRCTSCWGSCLWYRTKVLGPSVLVLNTTNPPWRMSACISFEIRRLSLILKWFPLSPSKFSWFSWILIFASIIPFLALLDFLRKTTSVHEVISLSDSRDNEATIYRSNSISGCQWNGRSLKFKMVESAKGNTVVPLEAPAHEKSSITGLPRKGETWLIGLTN